MVSFIDYHCHIDLYEDLLPVLKRASDAGVGIIINNGLDIATNRKTLELAKGHPEIKAALGFYPIEALKVSDEEIDEEIVFIEKHKAQVFAVGEIGLDFKYDETNRERQRDIFEKFVNLAIKINKPVIVHSRKAELECVEILEKLKAKKVVFHCFTGKRKLYERIYKNGWFFSVPANIYYSEQFQKLVEMVPITNLLCETDSPLLHPFRQENNEPCFVVESYKKIAEVKKMDLEEVKNSVFMNYQKLL